MAVGEGGGRDLQGRKGEAAAKAPFKGPRLLRVAPGCRGVSKPRERVHEQEGKVIKEGGTSHSKFPQMKAPGL